MLAVCYGLKCRSEIKELGVAVDRLGQSEPAAGGVDGRGIAGLGLDLDYVGHLRRRAHPGLETLQPNSPPVSLLGLGRGTAVAAFGSAVDADLAGPGLPSYGAVGVVAESGVRVHRCISPGTVWRSCPPGCSMDPRFSSRYPRITVPWGATR